MRVRYENSLVKFRISYLLEYIFLITFFMILKIIPLKILFKISKPFGILLFKIFKNYAKICRTNLQNSFPEKSKEEIEKLSKNVFINLVLILFEFVHIKELSNIEYVKKNINLINFEKLYEELKQNKGIIIITSHLGNWELEGAVTCSLGIPLNAVYFQQNNFLADSFFNKIRKKAGIKLINKKFVFRRTLEALKSNELVAFLSDQDAGKNGIFVDFFGRPASTAKGPIYFAIKTKTPVFLSHFIRLNDGKYDFILEKIELTITGNIDEDIYKNTVLWTKRLEDMIRKYPEQWFWVHKRWKTKEII